MDTLVCRCRVPDWRRLRAAVGLTQEQMARLLTMSGSGYRALEYGAHHCPREAALMLLRHRLRQHQYQRRLAAAGYAYPYPEDLIERT